MESYKESSCGLIYGTDIHHLDHIATLCCILDIPLVCTDVSIQEIAEKIYPNIKVLHFDINQLAERVLEKFNKLFSCLPKQLLDPIFSFAEHTHRRKLLYIWLPHGNSDKDNLAALVMEKFLLIYGKQMKDVLTRKKVLPKISHTVVIGNFRKLFYFANKKHFDDEIKKILSIKRHPRKTILYAPTWGSEELGDEAYKVISTLPDEDELIVKFHPNTLYTGFAVAIKEAFAEKENIHFVDDTPLVFPLLYLADVYVGDHSSMAYDFLSLNKPLFFLTDTRTPIHHTGMVVPPEKLYQAIEEKEDPFKQARQTLDEYAFEPSPLLESLGPIIFDAINKYYETEPHVIE